MYDEKEEDDGDFGDCDRDLEAIEMAKVSEDIRRNHEQAIAAVRARLGRKPMVLIGE